jgi:hypothetical protein
VVAKPTSYEVFKGSVLNASGEPVEIQNSRLELGAFKVPSCYDLKDLDSHEFYGVSPWVSEPQQAEAEPNYEGFMLDPPDLEAPPLEQIVKDVRLANSDLSLEQRSSVTDLLDRFKLIFALNPKAPNPYLFRVDPRVPTDLMASPDAKFQLSHHRYHVWITAALRDIVDMVRASFKCPVKPNEELRSGPVVLRPNETVLLMWPWSRGTPRMGSWSSPPSRCLATTRGDTCRRPFLSARTTLTAKLRANGGRV